MSSLCTTAHSGIHSGEDHSQLADWETEAERSRVLQVSQSLRSGSLQKGVVLTLKALRE